MVFGAKRLPELGRSLGTGLRGFKESINGHEPADELAAASSAATEPTVREPEHAHIHPVA
jgi:sec-independent protein translocase protein TatA